MAASRVLPVSPLEVVALPAPPSSRPPNEELLMLAVEVGDRLETIRFGTRGGLTGS